MFEDSTDNCVGAFSRDGSTNEKPNCLTLAQEDEFFDALCSPCSDISLKSCSSDMGKHSCTRSHSSESCGNVSTKWEKSDIENGGGFHSDSNLETDGESVSNSNQSASQKKERRTTVPPKAEHGFSLWSLLKHCIGKDLTKIPLPVYFNEPLSTLQRLTEEYEYAELLHHAAHLEDSCEQLIYIAAFVVSSYSSATKRTGKPFNPLLGETFECDRMQDLGWRCFSEQVRHHPPVLAQHCEGRDWIIWQEFSMSTKLKGTSLQVNPSGVIHLKFLTTGHTFSWNKVSTTVHNLVLGTLWLDHHGEIEITNHATNEKCIVQFVPYKCFSPDSYRKVTGHVKDASGNIRWILQGSWDSKIEALAADDKGNLPKNEDFQPIWNRIPPSVEDDRYYNMTLLASQLNEPEENVAPTDSRLRPDQRLMEDGHWEEANQLKVVLEEKQRQKRKMLDGGNNNQAPMSVWFKHTTDDITGLPMHIFTDEYWDCKTKQDWSRCPNLFL